MNKENMALRGYVIHLRITTDSVSVRVLQRERERENQLDIQTYA